MSLKATTQSAARPEARRLWPAAGSSAEPVPMRQAAAAAPPVFRAAPPSAVDRDPIWWPLALVALLLAVVAVVVAPAGIVAL